MSWLSAEKIFTQGTIVDNVPWGYAEKKDAPLGIILSNPCDLEHDKASFILIASLMDAQSIIHDSKEFLIKINGVENYELSKKVWEQVNRYLSAFIHNINICRYFFIDPNNVIEAPYFFVDFQNIFVVPIERKNELEIVASLPTPFKEKMIMHFSSYISRIGTDRHEEEIAKNISLKLTMPYKTKQE